MGKVIDLTGQKFKSWIVVKKQRLNIIQMEVMLYVGYVGAKTVEQKKQLLVKC